MILVDKQIREANKEGMLISEGFVEANLNAVSYDLTIDCIIKDGESEEVEYDLEPGDVIFIRTKEKLRIPENILGRIAEKNSRMRQGLKVDGPHYQPGHETYAFLRVQNLSDKVISLKAGMTIAQVIFEQLCDTPEVTYDKQQGASFQFEKEYRGLGNYKKEYSKQMKDAYDKANHDLEDLSQKIYGNVLTLMGVLVAVFSIITVNADLLKNMVSDYKMIVVVNVTVAISVSIMMGIILIFLNVKKRKGIVIALIGVALIALLGLTIVLL